MVEKTLLTCRFVLLIGIQHKWELSTCVCPTESRPEPAVGTNNCLGGPFFCADLVTHRTAKSSFLGMGRTGELEDLIFRLYHPWKRRVSRERTLPMRFSSPCWSSWSKSGSSWANVSSFCLSSKLAEKSGCFRLWVNAVITSSRDFLIGVGDPSRYWTSVAQTCFSQSWLSCAPNLFNS